MFRGFYLPSLLSVSLCELLFYVKLFNYVFRARKFFSTKLTWSSAWSVQNTHWIKESFPKNFVAGNQYQDLCYYGFQFCRRKTARLYFKPHEKVFLEHLSSLKLLRKVDLIVYKIFSWAWEKPCCKHEISQPYWELSLETKFVFDDSRCRFYQLTRWYRNILRIYIRCINVFHCKRDDLI